MLTLRDVIGEGQRQRHGLGGRVQERALPGCSTWALRYAGRVLHPRSFDELLEWLPQKDREHLLEELLARKRKLVHGDVDPFIGMEEQLEKVRGALAKTRHALGVPEGMPEEAGSARPSLNYLLSVGAAKLEKMSAPSSSSMQELRAALPAHLFCQLRGITHLFRDREPNRVLFPRPSMRNNPKVQREWEDLREELIESFIEKADQQHKLLPAVFTAIPPFKIFKEKLRKMAVANEQLNNSGSFDAHLRAYFFCPNEPKAYQDALLGLVPIQYGDHTSANRSTQFQWRAEELVDPSLSKPSKQMERLVQALLPSQTSNNRTASIFCKDTKESVLLMLMAAGRAQAHTRLQGNSTTKILIIPIARSGRESGTAEDQSLAALIPDGYHYHFLLSQCILSTLDAALEDMWQHLESQLAAFPREEAEEIMGDLLCEAQLNMARAHSPSNVLANLQGVLVRVEGMKRQVHEQLGASGPQSRSGQLGRKQAQLHANMAKQQFREHNQRQQDLARLFHQMQQQLQQLQLGGTVWHDQRAVLLEVHAAFLRAQDAELGRLRQLQQEQQRVGAAARAAGGGGGAAGVAQGQRLDDELAVLRALDGQCRERLGMMSRAHLDTLTQHGQLLLGNPHLGDEAARQGCMQLVTRMWRELEHWAMEDQDQGEQQLG